MARRTSAQERADYMKGKIAYIFLLTPFDPAAKQFDAVIFAKELPEANTLAKYKYPCYKATLISMTNRVTL